MKLALLSNVTVDLIAAMIKEKHNVYIPAGYDTWQQEIINPNSALYEYKPEAVVILIHADAYEWKTFEKGCRQIEEWLMTFRAVGEKLRGIPIFVSSIDIKGRCNYGAELRIAQRLEDYLIEGVQKLHQDGISIYVLPVKETITEIGRNAFYSAKMWYVGAMPYSIKGLKELKELIIRYISVTKGMYKKCICVDLDNTLWGGVIGEDGIEGIVLSNQNEGLRYYDTQKVLKKMQEQGVMLAILSKNNMEDVEPVFKHPHMILKREDFVAQEINWAPKHQNIRQLAHNLNIGLDSLVFLDDNPAEREQMKAECPEVTVLDFPNDSSLLPETVEKAYYKYFLSLEVTGEDLEKTSMYRADSLRKAEMLTASSVEDYLKRLEMTMDIHRMCIEEEKRVVQLVNKTNQFNVTSKRYSEDEIRKIAESGDIVTVHVADKYGAQGLVSVLILRYLEDCAEIDTFLMSCRVMGRNVEVEIMARLKGMLREKGIKVVKATYIKTAKNSPVEDLFEKLGFEVVLNKKTEKRYMARIDDLPMVTSTFKDVTEEWS